MDEATYDLTRLHLVVEAGGHAGPVHTLLPVPGSEALVSAATDHPVRVHVLPAGAADDLTGPWVPPQVLRGRRGAARQGTPHRLAMLDDRHLLMAMRWSRDHSQSDASLDTELRIVDLSGGDLVRRVDAPWWVSDLDVDLAGGRVVVVGHMQGRVAVLDLAALRDEGRWHALAEHDPSGGQPRRCGFLPVADGPATEVVVATWWSDALHVLDVATLTPRRSTALDGLVGHVATSTRHVVVDVFGSLRVFDHGLAEVARPELGAPASASAFDATGARLLVARRAADDEGGVALVLDVDDGFAELARGAEEDGDVTAVAWVDGGTVASAGGSDHAVTAWDVADGATWGRWAGRARGVVDVRLGMPELGLCRDVPGHVDLVLDLERLVAREPGPAEQLDHLRGAVHERDGRRMAVEERWGHVNLWLSNPPEPLTGTGVIGWAPSTAFTFTDAGHVVLGTGHAGVHVIRRADGSPGRDVAAHGGTVRAIAADGDWVATTSDDLLTCLVHVPEAAEPRDGVVVPAPLSIVVTDDLEWVAWTPSGFHAASEGGAALVGFQLDRGADEASIYLPADRFTERLYRPDVIRAVLLHGNEAKALAALGEAPPALTDLVPPIVEDVTVDRVDDVTVALRARVVPGGCGLDRVWAVHDGFVVAEVVEPSALAVPGGDGSEGDVMVDLEAVVGPVDGELRVLARCGTATSPPVAVSLPLVPVASSDSQLPALPATGPGEPLPGAGGALPPTSWGGVVVDEGGVEVVGGPATGSTDVVAEPVVIDAAEPDASVVDGGPVAAPTTLPRTRVELVVDADGTTSVDVERGGQRARVVLPAPLAPQGPIIDGGRREPGAGHEEIAAVTGPQGPLDLEGAAGRGDQAASAGLTGTPIPVQASPSLPTLFLLAVGVAKLAHPRADPADPRRGFLDLQFADDDARELVKRLAGQEGRRFGRVRSWELVDEAATLAGVRTALSELAEEVRESDLARRRAGRREPDVVVVFMSGHGLVADGTPWFWVHDLDLDDLENSGLGLLEVGRVVSGLPAHLVVMIDACRSGAASTSLARALEPEELARRLHAIDERAQAVFSSTTAGTLSYEHEKLQHGLFTRAVLEALREDVDDARRSTTLLGLADAVQRRVPMWSKRYEVPQVPMIRFQGDLAPLVLARP